MAHFAGPPSSRAIPTLLDEAVGATMMRLAMPMALGIAVFMLFNVVDTIFVGRLGARELAAMSFTFPVSFVVMNLSIGIGIGTTSAIARSIGEGDQTRVRRIATDAVALVGVMVTLVAVIGVATIDPLFRLLGATDELLPLIRSYMVPLYVSTMFLGIPVVCNAVLRATGDARSPMLIMLVAGGINVVLDPLLIFGIGPFPRLELQGAAIATVIAWAVALVVASWVVARRKRLLTAAVPRPSEVADSWKRVLYVGLPAAATNMLIPISGGIFTRLLAEHGETAVAAFGVGTRVESLSMIVVFALTTAITPFVGQNFGAKRCDRVRAGLRFSIHLSIASGVVMAASLAALAAPIARLFNDDPDVIEKSVQFMWLLPISYGPLGISMLVNALFNAAGEPMKSAGIIIVRLFVFSVPMAYLGAQTHGVLGVFVGLSAANFLVGGWALFVARRFLSAAEEEMGVAGAVPAPEPGPG